MGHVALSYDDRDVLALFLVPEKAYEGVEGFNGDMIKIFYLSYVTIPVCCTVTGIDRNPYTGFMSMAQLLRIVS